MISEPHLTLGEIAERLGISAAWLSIVKNSDSFKDYWTLRSRAHSDAITAGIREKAAALTELSLDVLLQDTVTKIDMNVMSASEARENLDLITKRFGFDGAGGGTNREAPTVQLNFGIVSKELLDDARSKLREVRPKIEVIPPDKESV